MDKVHTRPLIAALLALLGVWFLLRQVPDYVSSIFIVLSGIEDISADLLKFHGLHLAINALIGGLIIIFRDKLARWLVPAEAVTHMQTRSLIAVGAAVIGLYFFALGLISLGESFAVRQAPNTSNPYLLWRGIFGVGVGIALFVGSVGVSRMWAIISGVRN